MTLGGWGASLDWLLIERLRRQSELTGGVTKGRMRVERLTSTYSVGVIHVGSSCGQPGEENSNIAANKWLMRIPPAAAVAHQTKLRRSR